MPVDLAAALRGWIDRCEAALDTRLPSAQNESRRLHEAMRYAALGGGKRLRACLVYATGVAFGAGEDLLDAPAAAIEMIHAYSLVHDDLPAMDDDALRRGKPTVHVAYDEATAILAGDALQTQAFLILAQSPSSHAARIAMLTTLAEASGAAGMCGGQAIDIGSVGLPLELDALRDMHARKTGALIRAAVRLGALAAHASGQSLAALDDFASALGLAFQIKDDLLDVEADSATLGKTAGKDAAADKPTYVSLLGLDGARNELQAQLERMHRVVDGLDIDGAALRALGDMAANRSH